MSSASETRQIQTTSAEEEPEIDSGPFLLAAPDSIDLLASEGSVDPQAFNGVVDLINHEFGDDSSSSTLLDVDESLPPWHRRPSPWWMLCITLIGSLAMGSIIAPRLEILNRLVCHELRPEYIVIDPPIPHVMDLWRNPRLTFLPGRSKECMADPFVQGAVAQLMAGITITTGIISCFVGGWWGQFSDRNGRKFVLAITVLGPLFTDITMFILSCAVDVLPGGYRFILVPAVIDGLLGGVTAAAAASHAYIADCVSPASRSRYLAFSLGLLFTGITLGPALGALMITATDNLLTVYYLSFAAHVAFFLMTALVIPESLPQAARTTNIAKQQRDHAIERRKRREEIDEERHGFGMSEFDRRSRKLSRFFKDIFFFLQPLALFVPSSDGKGGKNWNLTLIAICSACGGVIIGSYPFKIQYANLAFGWDSTELAYYVSLLAFTRATFLVVVLPVLLKLFGPKLLPAITLPISPNEPLQGDSVASNGEPRSSPSTTNDSHARYLTASFDLKLARISLVIEVIAFTATAAVMQPLWWAAATIFGALGGGFGPALQSLAVELHKGNRQTNEVGRLFGALGVLQALCSQIIGPTIFGLTFMATVDVFPRAIFILSAAIMCVSLTSISLVRLPVPEQSDEEQTLPSGNELS